MLLPIVTTEAPTAAHSRTILRWYEQHQSIVFQALVQATAGIPTLEALVLQAWNVETPERIRVSALSAWKAIRSHYIRVSPTTPAWLQQRLAELKPSPKESMTAFLLRCEGLRALYAEHGHTLEDGALITRVMNTLAYEWWQDVQLRLGIPDPHAATWAQIQGTLTAVDTARRGATIYPGQTAGLPLGMSARGGGGAASPGGGPPVAAASSSQPTRPSGGSSGTPPGSPKKAQGKGKKKNVGPRGPDGKRIMVCWIRECHGNHSWLYCPMLKGIREQRGRDWRPSAADTEAAQLIAENQSLRAQLAQAEGESEAGASAARAGASTAAPVQTQGEPAPDLVPRPVRLGPRQRLEYVGDPRGQAARPTGGEPPVL
jgi:hypothetical protein